MSGGGRLIAVEGPIGVGKTTLARRLADSLGGTLLLEQAEANPFLERFYRQPREAALSTQLHFLLQRAEQMRGLAQSDLFDSVRITDFVMEKDRLFAEVNLDADEFALYCQVYDHLVVEGPRPDLVIYLQAPVKVLQERIDRRGIDYERHMGAGYLQALCDAYTRFFHEYDAAPLLIVNATEINLAENEADYAELLEQIRRTRSG
ncbi:MAG: deoxynucleoside kinase, partial [Halofilum sp. (in: g-proteobacteria)]|nr:deoxynucleoside kinase [Halofilum sp. (in: g-proteobacteria)]